MNGFHSHALLPPEWLGIELNEVYRAVPTGESSFIPQSHLIPLAASVYILREAIGLDVCCLVRGRERVGWVGERDGGREGWRERGMEGERERGREGGNEGEWSLI